MTMLQKQQPLQVILNILILKISDKSLKNTRDEVGF